MACCEYVAYCPHCDISIELAGKAPLYVEGVGCCSACGKKRILIGKKSAKNRVHNRPDCGSSTKAYAR